MGQMGKTKILGASRATAEQMAAYLLSINPAPQINMAAKDFCQLYLDTAAREGVRGDALFAQSCKETGNFTFRGTVKPEQNNFAGLGTTDPHTPGASFSSPQEGILAQAQHAKAYATKEPLSCPCMDPRYSLLIKYSKAGTANHWEDLGGKWAVPGYDTNKYKSLQEADDAKDSYGYQIIHILNKILKMPEEEKAVTQKKIIVLDAGHGMATAGKRCLKSLDPNETREWWLNDRIVDRVQELLSAYNCTVLRVDDTTGAKDVSLSARVKAANNAGAAIYISIHHNAGLNGKRGGGTVVFFCSSSQERLAQAKRLYTAVVDKTGLQGNRSQVVVNKGFYVIKNTKMPAFLVENGFMDSVDDVPVILSAAHAEKTAQGILNFLVADLSLAKKGQAQVIPSTAAFAEKPQETPAVPYTVVNEGDTLSSIARRFGMQWKDLADANGIASPYTIYTGQKIYLPIDTKEIFYYPAYTGKKTTLAAALTSRGINSSYSFRKKIASANGISGYMGTAAQNTQMYNLLTAGLLKRVQE